MQPQADPYIVPLCSDEIKILFQDDHLILIDKPCMLLSLSGKHPLNKDSVHYRLVKDFPLATMVHRLDFGTSGIMVVALNKTVNAHLTRQFQARAVIKHYTAVLHGHLHNDHGTIDLPIAKGEFPLQKICYSSGRKAVSRYRVIERLSQPRTTRVWFTPLTGRTHQLRIHSREIGHAIAGCDLYATDDGFQLSQRLMLHASELQFEHPVSGAVMKGVSPCPF